MNARHGLRPEGTSPWYRSVMLWFALALPAATVVAGVITYRIAAAGSSDADPDPVQRVAQVQTRDLAVDQRASELGLRGELIAERGGGQYTLRLQPSLQLARLRLQLRHPTQARDDQQVTLERQSDGSWIGHARPLQQGTYTLSLLPEAGDWRLVGVFGGDIGAIPLQPLLGAHHD